MKITGWPLIVLTAFFHFACSSDSEKDLMGPVENPDPTGNEDGPVSYMADISTIISNNCLSCHSDPPRNAAPFPLVTYDQVRSVAESGALLTAISRQTGESRAMPPDGRLPQTTIDIIDQWIQEGLLEK